MIEEKLKQLILEKYKSVKAFSSVVDIPYTTLDSILKRGVEKANVLNIIKMCKTLNIDTDSLAMGEIVPKSIDVLPSITADENKHIKKYRSLNQSGKDKATEYIDDLLENPKYVHFEPDYNALKQQGKDMSELATNLTPVKVDINK